MYRPPPLPPRSGGMYASKFVGFFYAPSCTHSTNARAHTHDGVPQGVGLRRPRSRRRRRFTSARFLRAWQMSISKPCLRFSPPTLPLAVARVESLYSNKSTAMTGPTGLQNLCGSRIRFCPASAV